MDTRFRLRLTISYHLLTAFDQKINCVAILNTTEFEFLIVDDQMWCELMLWLVIR